MTVRHDRPAPGAHLHQKAWERSLGGPPEASPIPPPPPVEAGAPVPSGTEHQFYCLGDLSGSPPLGGAGLSSASC